MCSSYNLGKNWSHDFDGHVVQADKTKEIR